MTKGAPNGRGTTWSGERLEMAMAMWKRGNSATEIQAALNAQPGVDPVSRNAVIGKLHQVGLTSDSKSKGVGHHRPVSLDAAYLQSTPARAQRPAPRMVQRLTNHGTRFDRVEVMAPSLPDNNAADDKAPERDQLTVFDLSDKICRWPIGDVGDPDFTFCGAKTDDPPYCAHHTRIARAAPAARRVPGGFVSPQSKVTGGY